MPLSISPFEEAAPYYDSYRAPYAPAAIQHVVSHFGLTSGLRILDLGCGPGTLTIPFSRTGAEVVAVDCDPRMIREAIRLAAERDGGKIQWIEGGAEQQVTMFGHFKLVTFGSSLHWMDRDRILHQLKDVIVDGGGIAIFDEGKRRPQESWENLALQVATKYLGPIERHPLKHPEEAHEPALMRSSRFSRFSVHEFQSEISRDVQSILGCIYSWVSTKKSLFGNTLGAFEAELAEVLLEMCPSGVFKETVQTALCLAPKQST